MGLKTMLLAAVFAAFTAQTGWVLWLYGMSWVEVVFQNPVSTLVFVDLCIALTMVMTWMWLDARDRGWNVWPYLVVTLMAGSVGPLAYLIRREWGQRREGALATG